MACKAPAVPGSTFYNYKGFFSIVFFATVDSDYKFIYIYASSKGQVQMHNSSDLKEGLGYHLIMAFPDPDALPNDTLWRW